MELRFFYRLPGHLFQPVKALKDCPKNTTTIVLSHNPASTKKIAFNDAHLRVDLILSGYLHLSTHLEMIGSVSVNKDAFTCISFNCEIISVCNY